MIHKNEKLQLAVQGLTFVPLILFTLIYIDGFSSDTRFYWLVFLLFTGMFSITLYRYTHGMKLIRYPLLLLLVVSYLVYAFYGLGSHSAPQTFQTFYRSGSAILTLPQKEEISKICYYKGINRHAVLSINSFENNRWQPVFESKLKFPYSFLWHCVDTNLTTQKLRFRYVKGSQELGEVRVFDKASKPLEIESTIPVLVDEPHTIIDTTYYGGSFFDEIYFARTAYEILHQKRIYENTHPYLGKILIGLGIQVFDMTPFGWRIVPVIFAALMIVLIYYFARLLFRSRLYAFSAAYLLTYSFMHFAQARLALVDTFGVFFILMSYYLLYLFVRRQYLSYLLLSGLFFGLASAIKWSAVFASAGFVILAIYLLWSRYPLREAFRGYKLILYGLLSYGVVAVGVYGLTFYEIYLSQYGSIQKVLQYQYHMFDYHQHINNDHPYRAPWWAWVWDYRPIGYKFQKVGDGYNMIMSLGNPLIFWAGIYATLFLIYRVFKANQLQWAFLLSAFFGLYLPYAAVSREMFIYHFYYALPFYMLIVIAMWREKMKDRKRYEKWLVRYLAAVSTLFIVFYSVLSGYEIPAWFVDFMMKTLPSWVL